jgi:hypothetical protein
LETIPGFVDDLDEFIQSGDSEFPDVVINNENLFGIDKEASSVTCGVKKCRLNQK